jgi:hypothetical protein
MKKNCLLIAFILLSVYGMAQKRSSFPFSGGKEHMMLFFKDSLTVSPDVIKRHATGVVIFKFTADNEGNLSKMVVYYADDPLLIQPVIEALKRSNHKWQIPQGQKFNDYVITFSFNYNSPVTNPLEVQKTVFDNISNRKPYISENQLLLEGGILLPTVLVNYDIPE